LLNDYVDDFAENADSCADSNQIDTGAGYNLAKVVLVRLLFWWKPSQGFNLKNPQSKILAEGFLFGIF